MPVFISCFCYDIVICFLLQEQKYHDQHKTSSTEFHFKSVHSLFLKLSQYLPHILHVPSHHSGFQYMPTKLLRPTFTLYTECPRRNVPDFGRVFLVLKYTDVTQNTYVQSWTVTEIMAREKCGLHADPHTLYLPGENLIHFSPWVWCYMTANQLAISHWTAHAVVLYRNAKSAMLRHRWAFSCIVLGTLRTTMTWVRVFL